MSNLTCKCLKPVLPHEEYMALCKRASKDKKPLPAREFLEPHKTKPHGDYYDRCKVCGTIIFKGAKEQRKIRNEMNKVEEVVDEK